jgi:hypothetical protein
MSSEMVYSKNYLILQELCEARDGKYCPPAGVLNQRLDSATKGPHILVGSR